MQLVDVRISNISRVAGNGTFAALGHTARASVTFHSFKGTILR
jgi:hypothetical protein